MISDGPSVLRLAAFVNGNPFKPSDLGDQGLPVIRIRQLLDVEAPIEYAVPPARPVLIDKGDLIFSWSATLAVRHWYGDRALLNQHLFRVDPVAGIDRRWMGYVLRVGIERLKPLMHGSAMTHITLDMLRRLSVSVPDLHRQVAIADYLDTETARIDTLISKKRRLIELLQERWQSHVRRVMSGSSATRVQLGHLCTIKRGQSPRPIDDPRYFDEDGSHGWVRIEDVTRGGMYLRETRERLSEVGRSRSVSVGPGMVLISIAATVGKPTITAMKCCYHDGFVGLHHLKAIPEYVYFFLTLPEVFGGLGQVGTQANINSEIVGHIKIPLPDRDEQQRVVKHLTVSLQRTETMKSRLHTQLDLLTEQRQALITAAVTGEVKVLGD